MKTHLEFNAKDVLDLVEHAKSAPGNRAFYGQKTFKCLMLVHDDGVYLMSGGEPHMPSRKEGAPPEYRHVVYAKGLDPATNPNCWEDARAAVGGDDFGDRIPLSQFKGLCPEGTVTIIFSPEELIVKVPAYA